MPSSSRESFADQGEGVKSTRARAGSESGFGMTGFIRDDKTLEPLMRVRKAGETEYGGSAGVSRGVSASSSELSRSVMTMPVRVVNVA